MPFDQDRYEELHHGGLIGALVHYRERTPSTMDDARAGAAARGGEGCGDAYLAGEQTAGRGRFRRPWQGAPGASLAVTFHLCALDIAFAPFLGLAGALAAAEAVTAASGLETALKWPNDVLAGGRKLAGVLAEAQQGAVEADVFLGVGVNLGEAAIAGLPGAERALADGRRAAAVFVPASDWGRRLDRAFAARFEAGGGAVRARAFYFPASSDYAVTIKDALHLSAGERRRQAVEAALGREVVAQPARRRDLDMIFLAGSPRSARLLKPQLDFYRADDLPVYATSHVYAGVPSPLQDQDLDGIRFCDIPLVLDERLAAARDRSPRARQLPRFAALGADAYLLAMNLDYLQVRPGARLEGWTGTLSLGAGGRVFRALPWAQFRRGRAVPLAAE